MTELENLRDMAGRLAARTTLLEGKLESLYSFVKAQGKALTDEIASVDRLLQAQGRAFDTLGGLVRALDNQVQNMVALVNGLDNQGDKQYAAYQGLDALVKALDAQVQAISTEVKRLPLQAVVSMATTCSCVFAEVASRNCPVHGARAAAGEEKP